jgi:hypothetical protein
MDLPDVDALIAPAAVLDSTAMLAAFDEEFARGSPVSSWAFRRGHGMTSGCWLSRRRARRAGPNTAYLGADLPAAEWLAALQAHPHDVP